MIDSISEPMEILSWPVSYSGGKEIVHVGARFHDNSYGGDWEVIRFTGEGSYSPSGLGGTPTIECKSLSDLPEYWKKWVKPNGNVDWCGDSVARCIAHSSAKLCVVGSKETQ